MSSSLMRGTAILTIGLFLSKALGLFYLIPLYAIVGKESMGLYQYAYIPYNLFLSVAISGAPLAISKYVSKYNTLGDYATGRRLMKSGMWIMAFTGFVTFITLYWMAEPIAQIVRSDEEQIYTLDEIASVIRWVSFALIIVPMLSISRGFFQGYNKMEPTAVSQLIEQIVRIAAVLGGAAFVIYIMNGTPAMAINFAVFAAFIGALAGLGVLYYYWKKYQVEFDILLDKSVSTGENITLSSMYKEIFGYLVPFILIGIIDPLYQFVDMVTFNKAMASIGLASVSDIYLGMLNLLTHKFVMIPVMVATGFSMALIPVMTSYYTANNKKGMTDSLDQTFQIMMYLTVPMVIGLVALSDELYTFLYEKDAIGAQVLAEHAPISILMGLYLVTCAILQGVDRHKWIIVTSLVGLLVKMLVNIPLIQQFETTGAIIGKALGYGVTVGLNILIIVKVMDYHSKHVLRRLTLIMLLNVVMWIAVFFTLQGLNLFGEAMTRGKAFVYVFITAIVGMVVYFGLSYKIGLLQKLFGDRIERIVGKLKGRA